jgi:mannosylglycerate hydrolase
MPIVTIVPHTHWDREWYLPFQSFRARLVGLLDDLLPLLDADPSYAHFLLDGQTAVIDDYLAIRPEAAPLIRKLATQGRVAVGPWAIQMDEYMVSGETIVRDLQRGIRRAEAIGNVMRVGYLPDMFGHIAQMPQIFALADFDHAVVWRGAPSSVRHTAFWWEAPSGTRVRAEYLWGSYSNGRDILNDPDALVARAAGYQAELGGAMLPGAGLLLMNGTDHQMPQTWLGSVVEQANARQSEYTFVIQSLAAYLAAQPVDGIDTLRGELRSGARSNVLMGVASNRVDIHQICAQAERLVERCAEPLTTLYCTPNTYPRAFLELAWDHLINNSAHDSSCACSNDEVVDAVKVRYQEARALANHCVQLATEQLVANIAAPSGALVAINSSPVRRNAVVQCTLPGTTLPQLQTADGAPVPVQLVSRLDGESFVAEGSGARVSWLLDMIRGPEFAGVSIARYRIDEQLPARVDITLEPIQPGEGAVDLQPLRDYLGPLVGQETHVCLHRMHRREQTVLAYVDQIPGYGWTTLTDAAVPAHPTSIRVDDASHTIGNEFLTVTADAVTGTFSMTTADGVVVHGCDRLVDGGDGGDTYNYSPPTIDTVIDEPMHVAIAVTERGPVRAQLTITRTYSWPQHANGNERFCSERSAAYETVTVTSVVSVQLGEPFVRVNVAFNNTVTDHRLRTHIPLPAPVTASHAECAFTVVSRGLETEGGPNEAALPTWVSRRFVDASNGEHGVAVLHDGLLEYELVDDGNELAITLLRSVGYLSRSEPSLRPGPAGPLMPVHGALMLGRYEARYALLPHRGDWTNADLYAMADAFLLSPEVMSVPVHTLETQPPTGSALTVDGAEVSALMRNEDGTIHLRVFNPRPTPTTVRVQRDHQQCTGSIRNLVDRVLGAFTGTLEVQPHEIVTLYLDDAAQ